MVRSVESAFQEASTISLDSTLSIQLPVEFMDYMSPTCAVARACGVETALSLIKRTLSMPALRHSHGHGANGCMM